ncbi:hypothetical protein I4U23_008277 [Adineta vaga]|nr:hypothetical protein I4U23_008277 [Adineta vaga]
MAENGKNSISSTRSDYPNGRKQRVERWASRRLNPSNHGTATAASTLLGTVSAQKRSESSYTQSNRMLNVQLIQLGMDRQNTIDQRTFDQKLFINKQALKHKHNQAMIDILNYVRKCCKYADTHDIQENYSKTNEKVTRTTPTKRSLSRASSSTRSPPTKRSLSANVYTQETLSLTDISPNQDEKTIETNDPLLTNDHPLENTVIQPMSSETRIEGDDDDDTQKRHVQFQIITDANEVKSMNLIPESHSNNEIKLTKRNIISAPTIRSSSSLYNRRATNSASSIGTVSSLSTSMHDQSNQLSSPKRSPSRFTVTKASLRDFRRHPERYLSPSNCYLPLLRRQAIENEAKESASKKQTILPRSVSGLSSELDVAFDDAKSFLSDDNDIGKPTIRPSLSFSNENDRKNTTKSLSLKTNSKNTITNISEPHTTAMARLREREYTRLNKLIHSNLIEKIIEPLSTVKTDDNEYQNVKQEHSFHYSRQSNSTVKDQSSLRPARARQLADILRSIDSLNCSDTAEKRARKELDMEKNRAKLGILIF